MNLKIFPWDNDEKPYLVNDDGFEWYIDKETTKYAQNKNYKNNSKPLKAICFFVKKDDYITRVLVGEKQQILHEDTSLEGMACKIDFLRLVMGNK